MPVGYGMRLYRANVAVLAVFKGNSSLLPALRDDLLRSRNSTLDFLFCPAFINKKHRADIFFTNEEIKLLEKMAWVCEAYTYAKGEWAESQDKGVFVERAVSMY